MCREINAPNNWVIIFLICIITMAVGGASAQTLSVSGGSGGPGSTVTVSIGLSSNGGAQLAGVQWDLTYPSTVLTTATGTYWAPGTAATAAGKQASCNVVKPGDIRCLVIGFNNTSIQDGILATVMLQIRSDTTSRSVQVNLTGASGTDSGGGPVTMTGSSGSITIDQPAGSASVLAMAQLASGGGWDTTLSLVNTGIAASEATLNFFGNDGNPLQLPFTFPQTPSSASQLVASTLDRTLNANSLLLMESQQASNPNTQVGSAQLLANGNVGGFAIFKYIQTGQETVVPLQTSNSPSYMLAFDNTGVLATGLAIANVATQPAQVQLLIRDDTGARIGTDTVKLAPQGHTSFMLSQTYPVTSGIRGTVQIDTPSGGQITALGLRANGGALTALPVLADLTGGGGSMAQIASAGGWQTAFTLINTGTSSAQAQLSFFNDNGDALLLPLTLVKSSTMASTLTQTIAAGATIVVLAQGNDTGALAVGSAQLTTTGNVGGFAVIRYNPTGQEAVIPLEARHAGAYVLAFDNMGGLVTGMALANVSNQPANVPVILRDDTGERLGTATIDLPAQGHTSFVMTDRYAFVSGKRGTVEFDTPSGAQISALGVRATPTGSVTTIPVLTK